MSGVSSGGLDGGGGGSDFDKKLQPEGEPRVKRKMKTAAQLEILEKTYAVETYPPEELRAELSVQLGLSDRQLQMWFCHRRLKDRKPPSTKKQRIDSLPAPAVASPSEMVGVDTKNEQASGSGSGSSPFRHLEWTGLSRAGLAVGGIGAAEIPLPATKRYHEPPQAVSELRAIAFVEAQLQEPLREDGPVLGVEFDPLPPGAFGAPIVQQKPAIRPYETKVHDRSDAKLIKGSARALHEYQFLPEQPSIRTDTYERASSSHHYVSPSDDAINLPSLSAAHSFTHSNEQISPGYGLQGQIPSLGILLQPSRQGHLLPPASAEYGMFPQNSTPAILGNDAHFGAPTTALLDGPVMPSDVRVTHEEEILRIERKRKNEEARIAKEVEAHEKRIRKELEKQDIVRRKREEQMRKEMERQDRERRKEEERLLREKQREEERYQREQRRELERREKFLQKEYLRAEKLRVKEEIRREKEAARLRAANDRAAARKIAKESTELIDDERLELMEFAATRNGLPSMLLLDCESIQSLDSLRDMLTEFPPKSMHLKRPFKNQPWINSEENVGNLLMVWRFLITFADVLGLWPFTLDEFVQGLHEHDPRLLGEVHVALLKSIIKDIEDVARTPSTGLGVNQSNAANPGGGHPDIVEGAFAWGFDIRSWQRHLNLLTWPEILRQFSLAAGHGPKLKNRSVEQPYARDENECVDGGDVISNLRSGVAAENALAIMQERGFSNIRRSRHRLTPGTVKYAAFHVLSLEGSQGLTILDVAEKIQKSGLRDLTTSKTPEASIAAALSRDTKLFERTAPSTYCVRSPYRKDPIDGEAILSAARERIQVFKNGCYEGEADDAERDEAGKDDDSESDVAEDPEVDDGDIELKITGEAFLPSRGTRIPGNSFPESSMGTSHVDVAETSHSSLGNSASDRIPLNLGTLEGKLTAASLDQDNEVSGVNKEATDPVQDETIVDESSSGEPWVQGLVEGEYSDLSVEERLNALVALVTVANEGNSIRIVLEERMEVANALKKQMWSEVQVDKRRFKEEFVLKMHYSSFNEPAFRPDFLLDTPNDLNNPGNFSAERSSPMQEVLAGVDGQIQQTGYAVEKSRSQLKAIIGHKAEEMYVYRSLPLGQDRRRNRYWQFKTSNSPNDPGSGRIFVELRDGRWRLIDCEESFNGFLSSLDIRGVREAHLHSMLLRIEVLFKEAVKRNLAAANNRIQLEESVKLGISQATSRHEFYASMDSPSMLCVSDTSESSFAVGLGRSQTEESEALQRHVDLQKWLWEECFNCSILRAMTVERKRSKPLLSICKNCRTLFFEDGYCSACKRASETSATDPNYSNVSRYTTGLKGPDVVLHNEDSTSPVRTRLLKIQLALVEASIPVEALQSSWTDQYRRTWGRKLLSARSAEVILEVLTLLEGSIKRDFLSLNYETTNELLGHCNPKIHAINGFNSCDTVPVLPWLPQTSSSVALRLMELDSSIYYTLSEKADYDKDNVAGDFQMFPANYAASMNIPVGDLNESPFEAMISLQSESWVDSGRGPGRGRGRARGRGGRSQRRTIVSGPEVNARGKSPDIHSVGPLVSWKRRPRGRGGRKKGHRSIRSSRQSLSNKSMENLHRNNQSNLMFVETPATALHGSNTQETTHPIGASSSSERSEFDHQVGQASGDEYDDDLIMDDAYSNVFNGQSQPLMDDVGFSVHDEEEDYNLAAEEDDEDEQEDVDVDGFFNGDSDENRDVEEGGFGNADDATESSSGFSG